MVKMKLCYHKMFHWSSLAQVGRFRPLLPYCRYASTTINKEVTTSEKKEDGSLNSKQGEPPRSLNSKTVNSAKDTESELKLRLRPVFSKPFIPYNPYKPPVQYKGRSTFNLNDTNHSPVLDRIVRLLHSNEDDDMIKS